jgi:hypothetical protein
MSQKSSPAHHEQAHEGGASKAKEMPGIVDRDVGFNQREAFSV